MTAPYSVRLQTKTIPLLLVFIAITYTYSMRSDFFYINWLAGLVYAFIFGCFLAMNNFKLSKITLVSITVLSAWLVWCLIFTPLVIDTREHLVVISVTFFYTVISVILISAAFQSKAKANAVMFWACLIWVTLNTFLFIFTLFDVYGSIRDFSGIVDNRNNFAIITTFLITYLLYFKSDYKKMIRIAINIMFIVAVLLVTASFSLKGLWGLFLLVVLINYKKISIKFIFALIFYLMLLPLIVFSENPIADRTDRFVLVLTAPEELRRTESAYLRGFYAREGLLVFFENPLTGIGVSNSKYYLVAPHHDDIGTYSHNNYVELLLNGGIPAFLIYYGFQFYLLVYFHRRRMYSSMHHYLFAIMAYKLLNDIAWVSYRDWIGVFIVSLASMYYLTQRYEKIKRNKMEINYSN